MAAATRQNDCCTRHDACSPTPLVEYSPNVFINGKGAGRVGDNYAAHGCAVHPSHQDTIRSGSSTVFINGVPSARIGDAVTLAGFVRDGSTNVFIGD